MPCLTPKQLGEFMSGTGLERRHLYPHIWQLIAATSLDLSWCCGQENPRVASPSGLDFLTLWPAQGSCTSSVKPQGSKSERRSEQGSVTSTDCASEVSKPLFYPILLVTSKSQTCPDSRGEDTDPISDGGIVKRPVAILLYFPQSLRGYPQGLLC